MMNYNTMSDEDKARLNRAVGQVSRRGGASTMRLTLPKSLSYTLIYSNFSAILLASFSFVRLHSCAASRRRRFVRL